MSAAGGNGARAAAAGSAMLAAGTRRASSEGWTVTRRAGLWLRLRAAAAWAASLAAILAVLAWLATRARSLAAWLRIHVPAAIRELRTQLRSLTDGQAQRDDTFPAPAKRPPEDARADRHAA